MLNRMISIMDGLIIIMIFFICHDCGLLFLNPMIADSELFNMYPEDYYSTNEIENIIRKNTERKKFNWIINLLLNSNAGDLKRNFVNKNVLDLGIGDCSQLYKLKKNGANAYGTEIRESACLIGSALGISVKKGTLLDAKYPDEFFDYIRSNHTFEHITNPRETLSEIYRILKKKWGTFYRGSKC